MIGCISQDASNLDRTDVVGIMVLVANSHGQQVPVHLLGAVADRPRSVARRLRQPPTPSGKYCFGNTPMETFLDFQQLACDKILDRDAPATVALSG
jgi:hypothetical protein